jgi:hypothetical protein
MRVQRYARGSVRFDRRRRTWNYLWYEAGKRRSKLIGNKQEFPTKAAAWKEVDRLQVRTTQNENTNGSTMREVMHVTKQSECHPATPRRMSIARFSRTTSFRSGEPRSSKTCSRVRLSCGSVSCRYHPSPKLMSVPFSTASSSLRCGPASWTSAAIRLVLSRTKEQCEEYGRHVVSRRTNFTLC